jgi:tungstate transport system permease protein
MNDISSASVRAFELLMSGDVELWTIIGVSFSVSLRAILIAVPIGLPVALLLAFGRFPGRRMLVTGFNSLMAVPAVVVGLTVYLMLSRAGPFGDLKLLFTQTAMVIGQAVLALPLLIAMAHAALQSADLRAWETALTLGAPRPRALLTVMHEVRFALMAAVIAAFGRVIAEVGVSLMVGGNILSYTRNIPTAIALETSKGEFAQGIALGAVLLFLALVLNFFLNLFQGRGELA